MKETYHQIDKCNDYNNLYTIVPEYDFENTSYFNENIFNGNTDFKSTQNNELIIGNSSDAIKKADMHGTLSVPLDILGVQRSSPGDIGAYEHITFDK